MKILQLYIDDSGTRCPNHQKAQIRQDKMDWFGLGGILIRHEDVPYLSKRHQIFCEAWKLIGPLHSTRIRTRQKQFAWLGHDTEREKLFIDDLSAFLVS